MYMIILAAILILGLLSRATGERPVGNPRSFPPFATMAFLLIIALAIELMVDGGNLTR